MIDLCIIIFLIFGILIGYKQGFTKSLVSLCGFIIVIILSFILKNPVSEFMMLHLPFFDFYGLIKGVSVLNIAVYEIIAFLLVFNILLIALKVLSLTTSIFEKMLSMTILLGLPSKILGTLLGLIKNYLIVFAILYVLALPNFSSVNLIQNSKLQEPILSNTPVLSIFAGKMIKVTNEFTELKDKYNGSSSNEFNKETLDLFLKYDIVKPKTVIKLIESDKLHINGAEEIIKKI